MTDRSKPASLGQRLADMVQREFEGPPASEDPNDPSLPRCQALEQIGFRSTQIIESCERPGSELFEGRNVCPGHAHQLRRQREIERTMPIGWTNQGRIYR